MGTSVSQYASRASRPSSRLRLAVPRGLGKVLLHSCCAPCSGEVIEALAASDVNLTVYFYNPNIHPRQEYERRKLDNMRFAEKMGVPFVDDDYNNEAWLARVKGLEWEPEKGRRCTICFDMRLERAALYAHGHGFPMFTSCLGISRWKNMDQVNACGHRAAMKHAGLAYWDYNWRKHGGANRMIEITKRENFHQQEYCGCVYSLRDTNLRRRAAGKPPLAVSSNIPGQKSGVAAE